MRTFMISSLFLAAAVAMVSAGIRDKIAERISDRKEFDACLKELEVTHSDYRDMKANHDPEVSCIDACLLRHKGVLNHNHMDLEKALEVEHHKRSVDRENAKSDEKVAHCIDKANKRSDDCEKAGEYVLCMKHPKPYNPKDHEHKETEDKDHHNREKDHPSRFNYF